MMVQGFSCSGSNREGTKSARNIVPISLLHPVQYKYNVAKEGKRSKLLTVYFCNVIERVVELYQGGSNLDESKLRT